MQLKLTWTGQGLDLAIRAVKALGSEKGAKALTRALNHTGNVVYTNVVRSLAKQVGLNQSQTVQKGAVSKRLAGQGRFEYQIRSHGRHLTLGDFKPAQFIKGAKASPWGKRQLFEHAFIVKAYRGDVFKRQGKKRGPLEVLYGPSIPKEMVRGDVAVTFQTMVTERLPKRVEHEIKAITNKVLS